MVTGESPGEDEVSPQADDVTLQTVVTQEALFVDFLRTDEHDEDGVSHFHVLIAGDQELSRVYNESCAPIRGSVW